MAIKRCTASSEIGGWGATTLPVGSPETVAGPDGCSSPLRTSVLLNEATLTHLARAVCLRVRGSLGMTLEPGQGTVMHPMQSDPYEPAGLID